MKLEVGMYVRTKRDGIGKIISLSIGSEDECCFIELSKRRTGIKEHNIIKASHNIIDLIEVGDYVNGEKVSYIDDCDGAMKEYYYDYEDVEKDCGHYFEEIKSIVTKEMFENMKYEVK